MGSPATAPVNTLTIIRGTSKTLELTITDSAGAIVDITGCTVIFTIKDDLYNQLPLVQKMSTNPLEVEITEPRLGKALIYLTPADTHDLDPVVYVYDVWLVLTNTKRYAVIQPTDFVLKPGVTILPL